MNRTWPKRSNPERIWRRAKKSRRRRLIELLDGVFSEYVRRRDEQKGCITCGVVKPWREMQAGHYIRRGIYQFRWHEKNVASQCFNCNINHEGEKDIYRRKLVQMYGLPFVEMIEAERNKTCKISPGEMEVLIQHYRIEIEKSR